MKYVYEFVYYPIICCDYCNEIINYKFKCPACGDKYAETNIYCSLLEYEKTMFRCVECNSAFNLIEVDYKYIIILIENNYEN